MKSPKLLLHKESDLPSFCFPIGYKYPTKFPVYQLVKIKFLNDPALYQNHQALFIQLLNQPNFKMIISRSLFVVALSKLVLAYADPDTITDTYVNSTSSIVTTSESEWDYDIVAPTYWVTTTISTTFTEGQTSCPSIPPCETETVVVPNPKCRPHHPHPHPHSPDVTISGDLLEPPIVTKPVETISGDLLEPPIVTKPVPTNEPTATVVTLTSTVYVGTTEYWACLLMLCSGTTTVTATDTCPTRPPPDVTPSPPVITKPPPVKWVIVTVIDTVTVTLTCTDAVCACSTTTITVPTTWVPPQLPVTPVTPTPEVKWITVTVYDYETVTFTCANDLCTCSTTTIIVPSSEIPPPITTTTPDIPPPGITEPPSVCPDDNVCKTYTYVYCDRSNNCQLLTKTITVTDVVTITPPPPPPHGNSSHLYWTTSHFFCRDTNSAHCGYEPVTCVDEICTNDFYTITLTPPTPVITGPADYIVTTVIDTKTITLTL
ncbi:unnamed protein product [Ambrosiozyma monospora]|uniref:Unnamed protein product n=1 Tax=Ambrosiozyma monospora TaxID=43982 RepID=A0ACB5TX90_AMBMO|nr:unnamed protein product [Ambrosiozyma monospora]